MRVLVAIVHYFAGEDDPRHSSTDARRREERTGVVGTVVDGYRGLFGRPATIDIAAKRFEPGPGGGDEVDIALVTVPGCSLLDEAFCRRRGVTRIERRPDNPRMLGFHAHELFAAHAHAYDLFVFTEDDLRPADPWLFAKIADFNARHGDGRVLSPNRFEWNPGAGAIKTYVDGDLREGFVAPLLAHVSDVDMLHGRAHGRPLLFRRARNPHSGFFAVTQGQLRHWMRQPHWLDRDCGFVSPLESAATLGLAKTFAVFKPFAAAAAHLEIEHLDRRFSAMKLPWAEGGVGVAAETGP